MRQNQVHEKTGNSLSGMTRAFWIQFASAARLDRSINAASHPAIQCAAYLQPPFKGLPVTRISSRHSLLARVVCGCKPMLRKVTQGRMQVRLRNPFSAIVVSRAEMHGARLVSRHPATGAFQGGGKANGHVLRNPFLVSWPRRATRRGLHRVR